ncbi:hypothetical protein [Solidesulfovibrio sp.]
MDITSSYDTLGQQLRLKAGTSDAEQKSGSSTTTTTASAKTSSWANQVLEKGDSAFLSPILQTRAENEALQSQLTKTLAAKFEELGIDVSQSVTLTRDADGAVKVSGDHPDKDAIEQLFTDVPALTEAFAALAENTTTLKSMTSRQASSMVRANGYAAYLQQMGSSATTGDFFMSYMNGAAVTSFG